MFPTTTILRALKGPNGALALLYLILGIATRFLPLVSDLHYELSAVTALIASLLTGSAMIFRPRSREAVDRSTGFRRLGIAAPELWRDVVWGAALSLIPLGVALVGAIFREDCGMGEGIAWYLLLVPAAAAISAVIGALARTITHRRWLAAIIFLLIWLGSMARGAYEALAGPHIFMYAWQVGFFPGGSWDAELPITPLLVAYRAAHLLLASMLGLVVIELGGMIRRERERPRMPVVIIASLLALGALALLPARADLGLTRTDRWVRETLGDSLRTRYATIYYNAPATDSLAIWRAAHLTDFYIAEHARALGIPEGKIERVIFYLYPSSAEEKRMVGTASAAFTKPWARKLNMSMGAMEGSLRHELAHVMLAPFGNALGVSMSQGMLEGSAMALENDYNWRTLHQYARGLYEHGMAPPPSGVMSIGGFSSHRSSLSYLLAGSFSKWLIERFGMERYLKAYPWGDFEGAYGRSLDSLSGEYRRFIDSVPLIAQSRDGRTAPLLPLPTARYLFGGGSFFFQKCLRRVGSLNARGYEALAEGHYEHALERFRSSLEEGINYGARSGIIQSLVGLGRYRELLDSMALYARDTGSYPLLPYRIEEGDAHWALGDTAGARRLYDSVVRLDISSDLTMRAALRLRFLSSGDTLRAMMRSYFTRPSRTMQRVMLLSDAIARASEPEEKMLLSLMRAIFTADQAPSMTLMSLAPTMTLEPFAGIASGRGKIWVTNTDLDRRLIITLIDRLRALSSFARYDGAGDLARVAYFIDELGNIDPIVPGAEEYLQERWKEDARFGEYLFEGEKEGVGR